MVQKVTPLKDLTNAARNELSTQKKSKVPLEHKIEIAEEYLQNKDLYSARKVTQENRLVYPNLHHTTVSRYVRELEANKKKLLQSNNRVVYRQGNPRNLLFNKALSNWLSEAAQCPKLVLTYDLIRIVCIKIYDSLETPEEERVQLSNSWIGTQLKLLDISYQRWHGEIGNVPLKEVIDETSRLVREMIYYKGLKVEIKDILNIDETAFVYGALPTGGLTIQRRPGFKINKERITVAVVCNAIGEFFDPIFISTSMNHRCFKRKPPEYYGLVYYYANENAWMTKEFFSDYLFRLNQRFEREGRFVLIFVDNFSGHKVTDEFSNIKLLFFSPNLTGFVQPCDAGIIHALKAIFRRLFLRRNIDQILKLEVTYDMFAIDRLEAMLLLLQALREMKQSTFTNCWRKVRWLAPFFNEEWDPASISSAKAECASENELTQEDAELELQLLDYKKRAHEANITVDLIDSKKYAEIDDQIARVNFMDAGEVVKQVKDEHEKSELAKAAALARADSSILKRHFETCANMEEVFNFLGKQMNKTTKRSINGAMASLHRMIKEEKKKARQV